MDSILQNHTWELVDLPQGCKPLGYKWIFKKKMKADGTIDKYKARLVIKDYRQKSGLDYFDTHSLVSRITSIRLELAIASIRNLEVHKMDVKKNFSKRGFRIRNLHGTTRRVCCPRKRIKGLQTSEVIIWVETSPKIVASKV